MSTSRPRTRSTSRRCVRIARANSGTLVEIDKGKQVLFFVIDGVTEWVLNVSTGNGQAYTEADQNTPGETISGVSLTPSGLHEVNRQRVEGWWEGDLGRIYRPKYFVGGVAVHGSSSIPNYPASHGCVRVSVPAMDWIWDVGHHAARYLRSGSTTAPDRASFPDPASHGHAVAWLPDCVGSARLARWADASRHRCCTTLDRPGDHLDRSDADGATVARVRIRGGRPRQPIRSTRLRRSGRRTSTDAGNFRLFDHPDNVPATAITRPADGARWKKVAVPGNWTLQDVVDQHGEADLPWYTNVQMPFDGPPPNLPVRNPTGVYRRDVTVAKRWLDRRVVLHLGGAESVHAVYVNGVFVGYGTDSRLASEYDITDHVTVGRNEISVVVVKWSAHSYVEDQDQWWMGGLHREVYVEARAATRITSLACDAAYNHISGGGALTVRATVGGPTPPGRGWKVRTVIETLAKKRRREAGHRGGAALVRHAVSVHRTSRGSGLRRCRHRPVVGRVAHRYRVLVELIDPHGAVAEVHTQLIGFRSIEISERQLQGQRAARLVLRCQPSRPPSRAR